MAFQELSFFLAEVLVTSGLAPSYKIVLKFKSFNSLVTPLLILVAHSLVLFYLV